MPQIHFDRALSILRKKLFLAKDIFVQKINTLKLERLFIYRSTSVGEERIHYLFHLCESVTTSYELHVY